MTLDDNDHTGLETPLKTNPGRLVSVGITQTDGIGIYSYTVAVNENDARYIEFGCRLLIRDAFPGRDGPVAVPVGCGSGTLTLTGKSVGLPRFTDDRGQIALTPGRGARVRLSGTMAPAAHEGRAMIIFHVDEVIVLPARNNSKRKPRQ